jgi:hypothetical protein
MKSRLPNGSIMTGYYGVDGVMEKGWETEHDAIEALKTEYDNESDLFVVEIDDDNWVLAY